MAAMRELFGKETAAWIEPPFYCCYGYNITIGEGSYLNFNCNFVDDGKITVGRKVMFGPAVTIATVGHPIHPDMREYMYSLSVTIGEKDRMYYYKDWKITAEDLEEERRLR